MEGELQHEMMFQSDDIDIGHDDYVEDSTSRNNNTALKILEDIQIIAKSIQEKGPDFSEDDTNILLQQKNSLASLLSKLNEE
jgi:hypothetical protein